MKKKKVLGIDIGTTATKVIILDEMGKILGETQNASTLISKQATWAEEDPNQWWDNVVLCVPSLLKETGTKAEEIVAVGVGGMVPTLILLDENGKVLRDSIQQNDARSTNEINIFKEQLDEEDIFNRTGSMITQQSIGPKLLWLKTHEPENFEKAKTVLGSYDYINFKLTGNLAVEKNWALESGLYDLTTNSWLKEVADISGISIDMLPAVKDSSEIIGTLSEEAAKLTSLLPGTLVVAGSADHVSSAFSAGIKESGDLLVKLGGAGDILLSLDSLKLNPNLFMDYHLIPNQYLLNGCMASSGSLIKWFQQQFSEEFDYKELDKMATSIEAGSEGLIVLPYFLGEKTPIFDPLARGVFWGVSLQHTRAHFFRAIIEGISFGFLHHVKIIREMGLPITRVRVTNGGARSYLWKQITSDVLGLPLEIVENHPGSSLGVAFVAGLGSGLFSSWDDIEKCIEVKNIVQPNLENHAKYLKMFETYLELYEVNKPLFHKVNG
jgi:xylulokinase